MDRGPEGEMPTTPPTASVLVDIEFLRPEPVSEADLEDDADKLLDVLESEAAGYAVGPVVACNLETSTLEMMFSVDGIGSADVQHRIGHILGLVEQAFEMSDVRTTTSPVADESAALSA